MESPYRKSEQSPKEFKDRLIDWAKQRPEFTTPSKEGVYQKQESSFDVVDAAGVVQCRVLVTKSKEREDLPIKEKTRGRRLLGCVLVGQKDGKRVEIDILEKMQKKAPGVHVFLLDSEENFHMPHKKIIGLQGMSTVFNIFILLHEFGHARQKTDKRYEKIDGYYNEFDITERLMDQGYFPRAERLQTVISDIATATNIPELIDQAMPTIHALDSIYKKIWQHPEPSDKEKKQFFTQGRVLLQKIKEILEIPQKILERDANTYLLQDLRELRKEGINLLTPLVAEGGDAAKTSAPHHLCRISVQKTITTVLKQMHYDLSTYGASTSQLRKTYGTLPAVRSKPSEESPQQAQ